MSVTGIAFRAIKLRGFLDQPPPDGCPETAAEALEQSEYPDDPEKAFCEFSRDKFR